MKYKIFKTSLFFLFFTFVFVRPVFAEALDVAFKSQKIKFAASQMGYDVSSEEKTVESVVGTIISALLGFLGVIFVALMVYGGVIWMTAGGNDQDVEKAQKIIKNAAIGLVVVLISYSLSWLILNIFIDSDQSAIQGAAKLN